MNSAVSAKPTVLVTTDFSPASYEAFPYATAEARLRGGQVEVVNVFAEGLILSRSLGYFPSEDAIERAQGEALTSSRKRCEQILERYFANIPASYLVSEDVGTAGEAIIRRARTERAQMIVMASQGHGMLERMLIGSETQRVLRQAPCKVLIVPPRLDKGEDVRRPALPYKNILVTTDLSETSQSALSEAIVEAKMGDAAIDVVHVIDDIVLPQWSLLEPFMQFPEAAQAQLRYKEDVEKKLEALVATKMGGVRANPVVLEKTASVANSIIEYAENHNTDLIIMSNHGASTERRWLGTVAERVARHTPCPMMLVP